MSIRKRRDTPLPRSPVETTPARQAAPATGYHTGMEKHAIAESILQHASSAGLYVHDSPDLVAVLMDVDLDHRIPRELYDAVAALLLWLHTVDNKNA